MSTALGRHALAPINLMAPTKRSKELTSEALTLPSWDLTPRQVCDLDLLMSGAFSPLDGFLSQADYEGVCRTMRLADGTLWPIPVNLDVTDDFAQSLSAGQQVVLRHPEGMALAVLTVGDIWTPDRAQEAAGVFGTEDEHHPGVFSLMQTANPVYVGGRIEGIEAPRQHTFKALRHTPEELRQELTAAGHERIVAFQTRNPMHRAHVELTLRAAREVDAALLLHPVVGLTRPGDVDYYVRVRCYQAVLEHYAPNSTHLSLLNLAMRMAGPREAVWHAIIRRNHGATHFIVGRDHAGPGQDRSGTPYYGPYDAQEMLAAHQDEIGIEMVAFPEMVYLTQEARYIPAPEVPDGAEVASLSGTELRNRLSEGSEIPDWFSYPNVVAELRASYPSRADQGVTVFFTGLPSSGKSTVANVLQAKLLELSHRPITLLDGDLVRKNLSSELGFSREHRDLNILRIGYVTSEITKNHGFAICAPIAPFQTARRQVRELISGYGGFVEVHVATPVEVCEARDRKGLYAKARAGIITGFTGVDDPYETPEHAELVIDTTDIEPDEAADRVIAYLREEGYLSA